VRTPKNTDKKKLEELKKKIKNNDYLNHAIGKIAQTLTENIVNEE